LFTNFSALRAINRVAIDVVTSYCFNYSN